MKSIVVMWQRRVLAGAVIVLVLWSTAVSATGIVKSENDDRSYRYLVLPNQLRVLLVSDPHTEKSAASLDVNTGSANDPADRPGLAHFLEHMLFLGTKKYPQAGEYQEFISAHGGNHNAYTSLEHTNFFFDIDPQYLDVTLDRFSRFFIDPVFDAQLVERERNAVHSEYTAKIKDESRREWDALREIANPASKEFRFSVGTRETLADHQGDAVRDDLLAFYQQHYAARRMTLVVLGRENLDELESMVKKRFDAVTDKEITQEVTVEPLFTAGTLPARLLIHPLKDQRELEFLFPIPPYEQWYREKPVEYLGHLLGHEGKGSLFQILRDRGWVESLSAGAVVSNHDSAAFSINMQLTREGLNHVSAITPMVFQVIRQIETEGLEKWRYNEEAVIQESLFRYQEKGDVVDYVATLSNNLHYYAAEDVISGALLMRDFNEKLIRDYLGWLRPDNVLVIINASEMKTSKQSRYYQTGYSIMGINKVEHESWKQTEADKSLQLPKPNEFVAKNFNIKHQAAKADVADPLKPELLRDLPNLKLWFKPDNQFNVPRGSVNVSLRSEKTAESIEGRTQTILLARMLDNQLNEDRYEAGLAGLNLYVAAGDRGLSLMISGYNDKQGLLLTRALEAFTAPKLDERDFTRIKEEYIRQLQNEDRSTPYTQWGVARSTLISPRTYERAARLQAAKAVTLKSLQSFARDWLQGLRVTLFVHGNYTESDALKLSAVIVKKLDLDDTARTVSPDQQVQLPPVANGYLYYWPAQHPDTAVVHLVQGADTSVAEEARMRLLGQLVDADFYDRLRTQQQLGYVVYGGFAPSQQVPGLAFIVQSPGYPAAEIDARINSYLEAYAAELAKLPADVFEKHRQALIMNLSEKPKNQAEEASRLWSDLLYQRLDFTHREQVIAAIADIKPQDLAEWYKHTVVAPQVRKVVFVISQKDVSDKTMLEKYTRITDATAFKAGKTYFELE